MIIDILRMRQPTFADAEALRALGIRSYCSPVSFAEVFRGIRPGEEAITEAFFAARGEVILDSHAGRRAGSYLARYARSHGLGIADAFVAAAATTTGLHLWTLNKRDYPMPDIRFYEPPR